MADILSTLRELRSLEEKRAHGTLSPEEEARFQELQNAVSSRGPKPGPPTPTPIAPAAPTPVAAAVATPASQAPPAPQAPIEEPPFVDAELTEDQTLGQVPAETSEQTIVQAAPVEPAEAPTTVAPVPAAPESSAPVPMSPAELRQWNASFRPADADAETVAAAPAAPEAPDVPEAPAPSVFATPPEESVPLATDWLAPTPLAVESPIVASGEAPSAPLIDAAPPEQPLEQAEPAAAPAELMVDVAPEPTVIADDAPMLWTPLPDPPAAASPAIPLDLPAPEPAHDDGWTASVSWSAGIPPPGAAELPLEAAPEMASENEATKLVAAPSAMAPFAAQAFEPSPAQADASSAEVSTKKLTAIGEAFAAGESRVVVHTLGGAQKRGTLVDAHMNADFLELRLPNGEREMVSTAGLKAVFFVVPIGQEVPKPVGDPVTVTLQDGHQLSGLSPDYQVGAVGFFLSPTDQRSRTAKIYIYAGSVKAIS